MCHNTIYSVHVITGENIYDLKVTDDHVYIVYDIRIKKKKEDKNDYLKINISEITQHNVSMST